MAATETHLLLLGAVSLFEPVNGYQIRRELLSWNVQDWCSVNPGSIYNGLNTLANHGLLTRHDVLDRSREVTVYQITSEGQARLVKLTEDALAVPASDGDVAFRIAVNFSHLLTRARFRGLLERRMGALSQGIMRIADAQNDDSVPPWATSATALWRAKAMAEVEWLSLTIQQIRAGDRTFRFKGETHTWRPPHDDPGWEMAADQKRYRALLSSPVS